MTIHVNFIEGSRKSSCRNDAYSVVRGDFNVLAFIPVDELRKAGHDRDALVSAFREVDAKAPGAPAEVIVNAAKKKLGLG